jgi:hypothetical protein
LCARGTPLLNISLLGPLNSSIFLDAVNAAGISKTGAWIAHWHMEIIKALEEKHSITIVCVIMDGPSANQRACRLLTVGGTADFVDPAGLSESELLQDDNYVEEADKEDEDDADAEIDFIGAMEPECSAPAAGYEFKPTALFTLWCTSHVLNLAMADIFKVSAAIKEVLSAAVTVSNAVHRVDKLQTLLDAAHSRLQTKAKRIPRHCPTRFGIRHSIMEVCAPFMTQTGFAGMSASAQSRMCNL